MKEFKYTIKDELGIHARPAGLLVKEAAAFPCKVTIEKGGKEVDAKENLRCDGTWRKMRRRNHIKNRWRSGRHSNGDIKQILRDKSLKFE